ncbi:hypothetical protein B0H19DRAFT_598968 [Mycena capillaripes]|nr:hypothetical protein B0H19DRAFT_598968 [Mycena capillaripes]
MSRGRSSWSCTAGKTGGGAKWAYLSPHAPAVRVLSATSLRGAAAPLLVLPADYCVCIFAPHLFCVDKNSRLTACTRVAYIASIVFYPLLWHLPQRNARERTYRHPRRVLPYQRILKSWRRTCDTSQCRHTFAQ